MFLSPQLWAQTQAPPDRFTPPVHAKPIQEVRRPIHLPVSSRRPTPQDTAIQQVSVLQDLQEVTGSWRQRTGGAVQPQSVPQGWNLSDGTLAKPQTNTQNDPPPSFATPPQQQQGGRFDDLTNPQESPSLNPPEINRPGGQATPHPRSVLTDAQPMPRSQSYSEMRSTAPPRNEQLNQLRVEPQRAISNELRSGRGRTPLMHNVPFVQDVDSGAAQEELPLGPGPQRTCDEYRDELMNQRITDIVVSTSAPAPSQIGDARTPPTRTWTDCWGDVIGYGTLRSMERSYVVIEDETGELIQIPTVWLSDADMVAVSEFWAVPVECGLGCYKFEGRNWPANTVAWKASALCHNPLYFENIQLERYGHTHGPVMQPLHSTAHFFVSLMTSPYQAGINPPNECQYALGFYRPGSCAPWLKDPIPISLRGSLFQAGAVVGAAAIIP